MSKIRYFDKYCRNITHHSKHSLCNWFRAIKASVSRRSMEVEKRLGKQSDGITKIWKSWPNYTRILLSFIFVSLICEYNGGVSLALNIQTAIRQCSFAAKDYRNTWCLHLSLPNYPWLPKNIHYSAFFTLNQSYSRHYLTKLRANSCDWTWKCFILLTLRPKTRKDFIDGPQAWSRTAQLIFSYSSDCLINIPVVKL